jgi:hypothetical protein
MAMYDKLKYPGKITEKWFRPVIANGSNFAFFWEQEQLQLTSIRWENNAEISKVSKGKVVAVLN